MKTIRLLVLSSVCTLLPLTVFAEIAQTDNNSPQLAERGDRGQRNMRQDQRQDHRQNHHQNQHQRLKNDKKENTVGSDKLNPNQKQNINNKLNQNDYHQGWNGYHNNGNTNVYYQNGYPYSGFNNAGLYFVGGMAFSGLYMNNYYYAGQRYQSNAACFNACSAHYSSPFTYCHTTCNY